MYKNLSLIILLILSIQNTTLSQSLDFIVPEDLVLENDHGICGATATWTDPIVESGVELAVISELDKGTIFPKGINTVVYKALDQNGNSKLESFSVTVLDSELPVYHSIDNILIHVAPNEIGAVVHWEHPLVTDNCGILQKESTSHSGDYFPLGTTVVTYMAYDFDGNPSIYEMNITVDNTLMGMLETEVFEVEVLIGTESVTGGYTCGFELNASWLMDISGELEVDNPFMQVSQFTTITEDINFYAQYENELGEIVEALIKIKVEDLSIPTLENVPNDMIIQTDPGICTAVVSWDEPMAYDGCQNVSVSSSHNSNDTFPLGESIVTYIADDGHNLVERSFSISVIDADLPLPLIQSLPDITAQCAIELEAPIALDNCNAEITATTETAMFLEESGVYMVIWNYVDASGNEMEQTQTILISDTTAPLVLANEFADVVSDEPIYTLEDPVAVDNCSEVHITNNAEFPLELIGIHEILWTLTDEAGNSAQYIQNVIIQDDISSVEQEKMDVIEVYPNPSKGIFSIQSNSPGNATVLNAAGQKVHVMSIRKGVNQMNLEHLKPGAYTLEMNSKDHRSTSRLILE